MSAAAPLYFLHIAKTAGTSFRSLIDAHFAAGEIAPFYLTHELAAALKKDKGCLDKYKLVRGHMGYSPVLAMKTKPRIITMLRDPLARTVSHYEHIIRHADHWLFADLPEKNLSLEEFLEFPPTRQLITNFQVRNLAQDFDFTAPITIKGQKTNEPNLGRLLAFIPPKESDDALLSRALSRMETFAFTGITEQFELSMQHLCTRFGWAAPANAPKHNTAPKAANAAATLAPAIKTKIAQLTTLDQALYDVARTQFR